MFLLAAGWRCGSTLLQRMLMRECLVWGEPFGRAMPIDAVARQLTVFSERWPGSDAFITMDPERAANFANDWIANLYPPMQSFIDSHVSYLLSLFQAPATALGYGRWGFKEVRLGVEHAAYLHWLFPRARFLFLYRDPYASFRSFQALKVTYLRWPNEPIDTPERFGQHWNTLVKGFLRDAASVGGMVIRYEDLCAPGFDPSAVNAYLGFDLNMAARDVRVGASPPSEIPAGDRRRLQKTVGELASKLGYHCPGAGR